MQNIFNIILTSPVLLSLSLLHLLVLVQCIIKFADYQHTQEQLKHLG